MTALPALKYQQRPALKAPKRTTFAAWLKDEMRDRGCMRGRRYDYAEFARKYGLAEGTVYAWMHARRVPTPKTCRWLAMTLDLTVLEVVCAAGHLYWADVDDYNRAYHDHEVDADAAWAMMGE